MSLDLTIVNVAIPSIIDGLHASLDQILWELNAYSLVYAVLLITSGRLGDLAGPRNLFVLGVAVFTAASAGSGLSQNPGELIAARAGQGLGAALLSPQALPIMTSIFPPERRGARSPRSAACPASPSSPGRRSAGSSSPTSAGPGSSTSTCPSGC